MPQQRPDKVAEHVIQIHPVLALDRTDIARGQPVVLDAAGLTFVDHHALAAVDDLGRRYDTQIAVLNAGHMVSRIVEIMEFEHLTIGRPE